MHAVSNQSSLPTTPTSNDDQKLPSKQDSLEHSVEEAGAAEELLALASEASLSSPISRESILTPLQQISSSEADIANIIQTYETGVQASNTVKETEKSITDCVPVSANFIQIHSNPSTSGPKHVCHNCQVTSTPFWRKATDGHYYCNACGLYLRTHQTQRPTSLSQNRESRRNKQRPEMCANCGVKETPMWRKCGDGATVCNACGLYWKLHGCHRKSGEAAAMKKRIKANEDELNKKNRSTNNIKQLSDVPVATPYSVNLPCYSLESNLFHHHFKPVNNNGLVPSNVPSLDEQRKMAFLKYATGRVNAPIAPKPQLSQTSAVPPILSTIIQTLASSPAEELVDFNAHPLQPLITSIVSEKLSQRNQQEQQHQAQQQLTPFLIQNLHLQNFFDDQNYHSTASVNSNSSFNGPFLSRTTTQSPLFLNVSNSGSTSHSSPLELENHQDFMNNAVLPRPPSATGFLSRGQSPMTLMNKDLVDFVDFNFWPTEQGRPE